MTPSVNEHIARRVRAGGRRYWTTAELREGVESVAAAKSAIHRLMKDGELQRVRRGMYWHAGSVDDKRVRRRRVRTPGRAARVVVGAREAVGVSGWQAANALGLSTQLSPTEVVAVTSRAPRPIKGVRFVDRSARRGRREQRLSEMEVTILEALEGWDHYVELPAKEATARFVELLGRDEVRTMALARASDTEPAKVRERLRALLHIGGWHAAAQRVSRAVDERTREKALKVLGSYAT